MKSELRAEPVAPRPSELEDDFQPRYLSIPTRRSRGQGRRNLVWGVVVLFLSALLFAWALYLAGPVAVYTVACALATAAALYVLARARLLRQRNGVFLAGALICLLGVFLVLVQQAWLTAVRVGTAVPVPTARVESSTPVPVAAVPPSPVAVPLLAEAFKPTPADMEAGPAARVVRDFLVNIEGKPYRLREGDRFPVLDLNGEEVRLAAGAQGVAVPIDAVRIDAPKATPTTRRTAERTPRESAETKPEPPSKELARITADAQKEAIRKYPGLGVKNSPENQSFLEAYQELKFSGSGQFFEDPEWPLRLADLLATREGWADPTKDEPAPKSGRAPLSPADSPEPLPQ